MPSCFPRLSVVITPEQHRLLSRLGELQGRSQASYVRRLIELATPSLRAVLKPLERVEDQEEAFDPEMQLILDQELRNYDEEMEHQLDIFDPLDIAGVRGSAPAQSGATEAAETKRRPCPGLANS